MSLHWIVFGQEWFVIEGQDWGLVAIGCVLALIILMMYDWELPPGSNGPPSGLV